MIGIFGAIGWHAIARTSTSSMDMVINGAGYDVALAFAALQVHTSFASAITEGRTSDLMTMDLTEHGLENLLLRVPDLTFTGSVAWYENGEERIMRAHPAFTVDYPLSYIKNVVDRSELIICELGFQSTTLNDIHRECEKKELSILWIVRNKQDWEKLKDHPEWQKHNVFVGPHAYDLCVAQIEAMPLQINTGIAAMSENGNMLMLWQDGTNIELPISNETQHPEHRFTNIIAAVVNEMTAWGQSLYDAANNCSTAFQDWVDLQETGGADLERKVATFYKKVENLEHDALTGLMTRGTAEKLLAGKQLDSPLTMILIDIDHFKRINDTLGHHMGDQVLISVAQKIARETRDRDVAIRWGGEEFVVLLPGCHIDRAMVIAERIRLAMHQIHTDVGQVSASLGVAERADHETQDDWFIRVDTCLYAAKNGGRDRVIAADPPPK